MTGQFSLNFTTVLVAVILFVFALFAPRLIVLVALVSGALGVMGGMKVKEMLTKVVTS